MFSSITKTLIDFDIIAFSFYFGSHVFPFFRSHIFVWDLKNSVGFAQIQILALPPLTSCEMLAKAPFLSEPQCLHLSNGGNRLPCGVLNTFLVLGETSGCSCSPFVASTRVEGSGAPKPMPEAGLREVFPPVGWDILPCLLLLPSCIITSFYSVFLILLTSWGLTDPGWTSASWAASWRQ